MSHKAVFRADFVNAQALHKALSQLLEKSVEYVSDDYIRYDEGPYRYVHARRVENGTFELTYDSDLAHLLSSPTKQADLAKLRQLYSLFKYQGIYETLGFECKVEEVKEKFGISYVLTGVECTDASDAIGEKVLV